MAGTAAMAAMAATAATAAVDEGPMEGCRGVPPPQNCGGIY